MPGSEEAMSGENNVRALVSEKLGVGQGGTYNRTAETE